MVGLADFLWTVQATLGLATYLIAPYEIRQEMSLGGSIVEGLRVLNWLNVCNTVLCTFYLYVLHGNRRKQVWFILLVSFVSLFFIEDRTRFFFATLWAGYVLIHARQWSARKVLRGVVLTGIVLMIQFFAVATWLGKIASNNTALLAAANVDDVFTPLLSPYTYITGNFPALQAYVDSSPDRTFGAMTFYPAFKILRIVNPTLKLPQVVAEPFPVPSEINTFTWLHQFYTDFGVAGVAVGPWMVGLLAGLLYFHMREAPSFYSLYANGLISFGLTLSFMVNHLASGPVWYFLAVGIFVAKYVRQTSLDKRLVPLGKSLF
jgi:oligosaccharide repeat unit polymerase